MNQNRKARSKRIGLIFGLTLSLFACTNKQPNTTTSGSGSVVSSGGVQKTQVKTGVAVKELVAGKVADFVRLHPQISEGLEVNIVGRDGDSQDWKRFSETAQEYIKQLNKAYGLKGEAAIKLLADGSTKNENLENQINVWENMLIKSPDVMALSAVDMFSMKPQLEAAAESAIPVIGFGSGIEESGYDKSYAGMVETDYRQMGRELMEKLQRVGVTRGKILILGSSAKTMSNHQMETGLEEYRKANLPSMERATLLYRDQADFERQIKDTSKWQEYNAIIGLSEADVRQALKLRTEIAELSASLPLVEKKAGTKAAVPVVTGVGYNKNFEDDLETGALVGLMEINNRELACATVSMALEQAIKVQEKQSPSFYKVKIAYAWIDKQSKDTAEIQLLIG
ncbi:MAG: substrate-binding domain-containing protein [Lachnospiraceae bacterium]|nr:substrate-binding domain-containing protein [Lachnospiraceae bacterium]MDY5742869.1 substrate-binding domain-containing protein [Lachnospiraceae bacterium]